MGFSSYYLPGFKNKITYDILNLLVFDFKKNFFFLAQRLQTVFFFFDNSQKYYFNRNRGFFL